MAWAWPTRAATSDAFQRTSFRLKRTGCGTAPFFTNRQRVRVLTESKPASAADVRSAGAGRGVLADMKTLLLVDGRGATGDDEGVRGAAGPRGGPAEVVPARGRPRPR